jgi:hypothetical protein
MFEKLVEIMCCYLKFCSMLSWGVLNINKVDVGVKVYCYLEWLDVWKFVHTSEQT